MVSANEIVVQIRAALGGFESQMTGAADVVIEALTEIDASISKVEASVGLMSELFVDGILQIDATLESLKGELASVAAETTAVGESERAATSGMVFFTEAVVAFLGYDLVKHLTEANIQFQQMYFTLDAGTGSVQDAGGQMQWLNEVSQNLGVNLRETGQNFAMMLAAAQGQDISLKALQGTYLGLAKAFDIMHASTARQQRVMYAFNEMISMGTIHTRQFQRMLSMDLAGVPWAKIAADALGYTEQQFEKLLKTGKLTASEVIPAMANGLNQWAEKGNALESSIHGTNATLNRFRNAVFGAEVAMGDTFLPGLTAMIDEMTKVIHIMEPLPSTVKDNTEQFSTLRTVVDGVSAGFATASASMAMLYTASAGYVDQIVTYFEGMATKVDDYFRGMIDKIKGYIQEGKDSVHALLSGDWYGALHPKGNTSMDQAASAFSQGDMAYRNAMAKIKTETKNTKDQVSLLWKGLGKELDQIFTPRKYKIPEISPVQVPAVKTGASDQAVQQGVVKAEGPINIKEEEVRQLRNLDQISKAQEIVRLRDLESQKYQIERKALLQRIQINQDDEKEKGKLNVKLEKLDQQHKLALLKSQDQQVRAIQHKWEQVLSVVSDAVSQSIKGMIQGTLTLQNAMRNIFQSILAEIVDFLVKWLVKWVATHIAMKAISSTTGVSQVTSNAAVAASGAAKAVAGIPIIGPALAPEVAAATFASTMAYAPIASAAGGYWHVPDNMTAQIHKDEMVLPAWAAKGLRSQVGEGGGNVHLHVHAVDGESVKRLFANNGDALAGVMRKLHRNGAFA